MLNIYCTCSTCSLCVRFIIITRQWSMTKYVYLCTFVITCRLSPCQIHSQPHLLPRGRDLVVPPTWRPAGIHQLLHITRHVVSSQPIKTHVCCHVVGSHPIKTYACRHVVSSQPIKTHVYWHAIGSHPIRIYACKLLVSSQLIKTYAFRHLLSSQPIKHLVSPQTIKLMLNGTWQVFNQSKLMLVDVNIKTCKF